MYSRHRAININIRTVYVQPLIDQTARFSRKMSFSYTGCRPIPSYQHIGQCNAHPLDGTRRLSK